MLCTKADGNYVGKLCETARFFKKFLSHNAILTECYLLQSLLNHLEKESQGELQEFLTV